MPSSHETALLTVDEMGRADRLAVERGVPSLDLMEAAGASVVAEIRRRWPPQPVAVLCGPGNNGGDGFVVARYLAAAGWDVRIALLDDKAKLRGDALVNAERWEGEIAGLGAEILEGRNLVVDALFGAGLTRPIDGAAAAVIAEINHRGLSCVAVDMPSGIDGNTGAIRGSAPKSALSVTFFRCKPGHLLLPGRSYAGEVAVTDIGIPADVLVEIAPQTHENLAANWQDELPVPRPDGHKYQRGHAVIAGGGVMTGAARLAARGARRVGAGMLSILAPTASVPIYQVDDPGNIINGLDSPNEFAAALRRNRRNAVLVGPGAGVTPETRRMVIEALRSDLAVVLDADALTVFRDNPQDLFDWVRAPCVMTPHQGEFDRLFDRDDDKLASARAAAKLSGAVILFKGTDTIIADPDGRAAINSNAPPDLATAGAGDVLAGMITGLLAQAMPPFEAACAAAWLHGRAAADFGPGLIAEDLPDRLPKLLSILRYRAEL